MTRTAGRCRGVSNVAVRALRRLLGRERSAAPLGGTFHVPSPSDDYTGSCPCGCGALFRDGEQLVGEDLAWAVADEFEQCLQRIRAAALSDADLEALPALRGFLLRETDGAKLESEYPA